MMLTAICAKGHTMGSISLLQRGKQQSSTEGNSSVKSFPLSELDGIDVHVFVIAWVGMISFAFIIIEVCRMYVKG